MAPVVPVKLIVGNNNKNHIRLSVIILRSGMIEYALSIQKNVRLVAG